MFDNRIFQDVAPLVGRILLGALFILGGYNKIGGYENTVASIADKGIPLAELVAVIALLIELVGGIMLVLGLKARWAAFAIFLLIIPINYFYHPAWADGSQTFAFFKNLGLMGGMLFVMALGPGRFALTRD